jgi:choline dehydrogenase
MTSRNDGGRDPEFDYIVVGAGTAGCIVAARLSERSACRVLLLEAGERDTHHWLRIPLGIGKIRGDERFHWKFFTEPEACMSGQKVYWPRGRVLGGSGSVNGMIYNRGQPEDYDLWRLAGNDGWGFADLLPYFKKIEHFPAGDAMVRGRSGPVHITDLADDPDPLSDAFIAASERAGFRRIRDYNAGANDVGTGYLQLNIRRGLRCSTSVAYLRPAMRRANLKLETGAVAARVLFSGKRATGVEYFRNGETCRARAAKCVVLCAGTVQSPQLLELSGVGDADRLMRMGIPVVHHLPGVGENLQDHLQVRLVYQCREPLTLNAVLGNPLRTCVMGLRFALLRKGLMTTASAKTFTNVRALAESRRADVKIQQYMISGDSRHPGGADLVIDRFWGFSIGHNQMRPQSRGSIHVRSRDPRDAPSIRANYLSHDTDRRANVAALRISRKIASMPPLADLIVSERRPGPGVQSDDELLAYCSETGHTSYHPIGTCKMGSDPLAVVDARLRVRGLEGLRVVDASIMPTLTSCNTNAPAMMIGEKGAEMIAGG